MGEMRVVIILIMNLAVFHKYAEAFHEHFHVMKRYNYYDYIVGQTFDLQYIHSYIIITITEL